MHFDLRGSVKKITLVIFISTLLSGLSNISVQAAPGSSLAAGNYLFANIQTNIFSSLFFINSPLWVMYAMQTPVIPDSLKPDSTQMKNYEEHHFMPYSSPYRFVPEHPRSDIRRKYLPEGYRTNIQIDSSARHYLPLDSIDRFQLGYPYGVDLDTYLAIRKQNIQNEIWDSIMTRYDLKSALTGSDLAKMLAQSTGLAIPIPPNPVMGIFGKPEININVGGEVNVRLGWRWDSQNLGAVSAFGQTQSTPIFSQDIKVNVSGGIGDKLKLSTDWNTHRQFEYENKFKVGYEGDDDEIVKLVEVGNVQLPVPSSLIGGGQALFGVRADFQFGPLYLKTIASQRRGERKFINVQGGANRTPFVIRAYDFAKNHFFLDTAYKQVYKDYFKASTPVIPPNAAPLRVKEIEVWESVGDINQQVMGSVMIAHADLPSIRVGLGEKYSDALKRAPALMGQVVRATFLKMDSTRYEYDPNLGTITVFNLRQEKYYAVAYRVEGKTEAREDDEYFGNFSAFAKEKDTLLLKLIYYPNMQPGYKTLWNRQMKNIYSINATNVSLDDTKIGVWYINQNNDSTDVLQGAPDKLVTILGVDQTNTSGTPPPDGQFDMRQPFFNAYRGEITFPSLEPFREGLRTYFNKIGTPQLAEQYVFSAIYDTTYDVARRATDRDRFIVSGYVSGRSTGSRIQLGAFYLAPGSVRVTLDGVPLREFEDYVIDYYSGVLTLRNQRATLPNANLRIEYEQQDVFNISTRTLLGVRADYELFKTRRLDVGLGFTMMYYNQSAVIDRVRLGEEPVSNTMMGFDARMNWDTPWLTRLLNYLPFYDTKAQSSIAVKGEWALMMPEPNKRRSEVISDNNEPVVYIDDFEGAQRYISLSLTPTQWTHSSPPVDSSIALSDTLRTNYKGKTLWYQYFLPNVPVPEVYPKRQVVQGRTLLSPLYITFDPMYRGIYNQNPNYLDSMNPHFDGKNAFYDNPDTLQRIWGGFMRLLSSYNTNFDNENIEYIEVMMKVDQWYPDHTKMYVDLGQISEDVIPNQRLDTEDGITSANPVPNGILDPGEDVGIDAKNDAAEKATYPPLLRDEADPARDDFYFDFFKEDNTRKEKDFWNYNNYENNGNAEIGQFPDTEILNKNNGQNLTLNNDYFSYEVKISYDSSQAIHNPQIVGGNFNTGWFLYRIPIRKPSRVVGNPLFSNIQYIRVHFKGGVLRARIADWRLVGSQWQRASNIQPNADPNDSTMQVGFINLEENSQGPDYYSMPPGVAAPRQLNNPDPNQDIRLNEQSLSLSVKNLKYGDERIAVRYFRPMDVFYYKKLKFFIHGDGSMPDALIPGVTPKAYAFLRFGTDPMNYYEYRRPILRDWQNIEIVLAELTAIKAKRDSLAQFSRFEDTVSNDPLARFIIRGNPILTKVQFFGYGIANPSGQYPNELTTTMWVDELRLLSPEDRNDWAAIAATDLKLADLGQVNATFNVTKPNFHRLEERFGNRVDGVNWSVAMTGNLEKFAPKSFKDMKIPISYTHVEYVENPEFVANNDIRLDTASEKVRRAVFDSTKSQAQANAAADEFVRRSQTLKVQDQWALTGVKLGIPVSHWLVRETINRVNFGYSYAQEYERNPIVAERFNWVWILQSNYSVNIPDILAFKPLGWLGGVPLLGTYSDVKINILPTAFSGGINMTRRRTTEQSRLLPFPSPVFRDFSAQRQAQLSWRLAENGFLNPALDYTLNLGSTLIPYELDENGIQRTGSQLASQILFNKGLINFGENNVMTQTVTMNIRPRLPIGEYNKFLDMTGAFTTTYTWNNPMQPDPTIHDIAQTAMYNNNIRFNTGFKLKSLADQLFGTPAPSPKMNPLGKPKSQDSAQSFAGGGVLKSIGSVFKTIFLDFDRIDINFTQTNSSMNPGSIGSTGLTNFWGRGLIGRASEPINGPSFPYQLGLVTDPDGRIKIKPSGTFPFFRFETLPGLRPPNAVLQDNYSQRSVLELKTNRPLWEGATLELQWKTEMAFNKNQTVITDQYGNPRFTNINATESFSRTFLTFPTFFGFNVFNNTVEHVIDIYNVQKAQIMASNVDTIQKNQMLLNALAESFRKGLEAFSFSQGTIGKYLPAINWGIRWEGLEKWGLWGGIPKRIVLEHNYGSHYTENALITDNGKTIQVQQVQHGFQPLVGLTASFDEKKLNGTLTSTIRYNTTNNYQLSTSNRTTISRQSTDELAINSSYTMRGFEFPLFGINWKNDLEFSFLTSYKKNKTVTYDVLDYKGENGRNLNGNTQLVIEPRARYVISQRISAAFFVRYEGTFNEGASNPGFSTTQVGLDIRISIAGGR